jgi:hypothetical protein
MGAQIISAAIYFSLREKGRVVYADLSYFDKNEHIATVGKTGDISHWSWQLDSFGLTLTSFDKVPRLAKGRFELIVDGPKKLALGFDALRQIAIQEQFAISKGIDGILPASFSSGYMCIHMRRGDYVNVASHMVADNEFIDMARKFSGLIQHVVVVSDSPISEPFRRAILLSHKQVVFLDSVDAFTSHRVMRKSRIFIGSNSQFSLIAALLNPQALVVMPKQWFGLDYRAMKDPIHDKCNFQILNSDRQ